MITIAHMTQQSTEQGSEQARPQGRFQKGVSGCPDGGVDRRRERARRDEEARQAVFAAIVSDLGGLGTLSTFQRYQAREYASLVVEAERRRARGKPTSEQTRLM